MTTKSNKSTKTKMGNAVGKKVSNGKVSKSKKPGSAQKIIDGVKAIFSSASLISTAVTIYNVLHAIHASPAGQPLIVALKIGLGLQFEKATARLRKVANKPDGEMKSLVAAQKILDVLQVYILVAEEVRSQWKEIEKSLRNMDEKKQEQFRNALRKNILNVKKESAESIRGSVKANIDALICAEVGPQITLRHKKVRP